MTVEEIKSYLNLLPHPEGGYYREMYRSELTVNTGILSSDALNQRAISTAIYFLIEKSNFSAFHKIKSDELWHFYAGDALEVLEIDSNGIFKSTLVGNNLAAGEIFQYAVKANTWFGSRVKQGGEFSLVGCTVAPGFDFNDFELANRNELMKKFPQHKTIIEEMTRV